MSILRDIAAANRAGTAMGIPSWCTAHADTLRAVLATYAHDDAPILIEATCNQVNQFGGYTGMTPAGFRNFIEILAAGEGVDPARIVLGGDHLGPNPWRREPAALAMDKAKAMIAAFVEAGFTKIHLDASMACADDAFLDEATKADRAADLCAIAEAAASGRELAYVIGTEVPIPGGETSGLAGIAVTTPESVETTLAMHEDAFAERGLRPALERVIGVVVQPGVDFGNADVLAYDPSKAAELSETIFDIPNAVFEAHSTDYQSEAALAALVADHFAILKVGPELTFAFREAVVAMAHIEAQLSVAPSGVLAILADEMEHDPSEWRAYIPDDDRAAAMRLFGLSDRVRYYWPRPRVAAAVQRLLANIDAAAIERGILSQYAPFALPADPRPLSTRIVAHHVGRVVGKYRRAACA
ncbi:MAG TPA: class II D-tagatose-bisphosphate aldolase, non-catalytic subunit [Devosia sp.]|nr:class II D-tagatose-bisphosphate aldolase, non-catalytic subunit [Devosia sp.]